MLRCVTASPQNQSGEVTATGHIAAYLGRRKVEVGNHWGSHIEETHTLSTPISIPKESHVVPLGPRVGMCNHTSAQKEENGNVCAYHKQLPLIVTPRPTQTVIKHFDLSHIKTLSTFVLNCIFMSFD